MDHPGAKVAYSRRIAPRRGGGGGWMLDRDHGSGSGFTAADQQNRHRRCASTLAMEPRMGGIEEGKSLTYHRKNGTRLDVVCVQAGGSAFSKEIGNPRRPRHRGPQPKGEGKGREGVCWSGILME